MGQCVPAYLSFSFADTRATIRFFPVLTGRDRSLPDCHSFRKAPTQILILVLVAGSSSYFQDWKVHVSKPLFAKMLLNLFLEDEEWYKLTGKEYSQFNAAAVARGSSSFWLVSASISVSRMRMVKMHSAARGIFFFYTSTMGEHGMFFRLRIWLHASCRHGDDFHQILIWTEDWCAAMIAYFVIPAHLSTSLLCTVL